ncbi:HNH endonuclease family protein [Brevibacterium aurantiacum]|uniref:GmrSD restriction endonucleases C-terminal domain-containing protein n=1 Tax=Brevibacterium aurantiacum TaxID=273384 RepID=A0A2H1KC24_BREAU|nr:HNH endonuclease family protein [Brevibacterium aurantiacum]SMX97246.1 Protein of unknown function (DUF1524) [Brevibacterium aurantiacum]
MLNKTYFVAILAVTTATLFAPVPASASPINLDDLTGSSSPTAIGTVNQDAVKRIIQDLDTTARESLGTYDRPAQYGTWTTRSNTAVDSFCGTTREDIRNRDLTDIRYSPDDKCEIEQGVLEYDPYTGHTTEFTRQQSPDLEVEHIVPAEYHYDMIGHKQTDQERERFFDDSENLMLAGAASNSSKGSKGPAEWLVPENSAYICTYIARFSYIADKYHMPVAPTDKKAMLQGIDSCDNTTPTAGAKPPPTSDATAESPIERIDDFFFREHPGIGIAVILILGGIASRIATRSK